MRVMAIDLGDARTGIAVSDPLGMIAGETFVIESWKPEIVAERILEEARKREAETLVLGLPKNMNGSEGWRAEKVRAFAEILQEMGSPPVVLWDERRTTVDAHRILRENGKREKKHRAMVDAVAAALILEGYLNSL